MQLYHKNKFFAILGSELCIWIEKGENYAVSFHQK